MQLITLINVKYSKYLMMISKNQIYIDFIRISINSMKKQKMYIYFINKFIK